LSDDIPGFSEPNHGDLTNWAKQGVLLLNAVLTVQKGASNSHKGNGWEQFTDAVINAINTKKEGIEVEKKERKKEKEKKKEKKTKEAPQHSADGAKRRLELTQGKRVGAIH
jgi:uracil DNA glycosylase